ncbi:MAG: GNAT family N-acetyltransferase [Bacilli bacterium]|jgi:GNAT superfamily N-acetyltransferase|nr:GNAT family N-acetyltransferase [Bacilli bacterium]
MIRKAMLRDLSDLVQFNLDLAKESEDLTLNYDKIYQGVKAALVNEDVAMYYVYEQDNKVIGQIMLTKEWSDWRNGYFWWIQSVYIDKKFRRQGIFKALYEYVKSQAEENEQVCGLRLYVERNNDLAKDTYLALGMIETHYLLYEWEKNN